MKISKNSLKKFSPLAFIISVIIVIFFLFFSFVFTFVSIKNIISRFSVSTLLFLLIGIYFIYTISKYLMDLYKTKKKFESIFTKFYGKNEFRIYVTALISIVLLFIYYFTAIYLQFNFFINILLFLPIFILKNISFMTIVFLKNNNLEPLTLIIELVLPIAQIIYIYKVTGIFFKLKRKFLNKLK